MSILRLLALAMALGAMLGVSACHRSTGSTPAPGAPGEHGDPPAGDGDGAPA